MNRNKEKGATYKFEVTRENIDFIENLFETPYDLEMKSKIVNSEGIVYLLQYNSQTTSRLYLFQKKSETLVSDR